MSRGPVAHNGHYSRAQVAQRQRQFTLSGAVFCMLLFFGVAIAFNALRPAADEQHVHWRRKRRPDPPNSPPPPIAPIPPSPPSPPMPPPPPADPPLIHPHEYLLTTILEALAMVGLVTVALCCVGCCCDEELTTARCCLRRRRRGRRRASVAPSPAALRELELAVAAQTPLPAEEDEEADGPADGDACPICFDNTRTATALCCATCKSCFHPRCLNRWVRERATGWQTPPTTGKCPVCQQSISLSRAQSP